MVPEGTLVRAAGLVALTGVFWGFYWIPVRWLAELGWGGPWGTVAITGAAVCVLSPWMAWSWRGLIGADRWAVLGVLIGGAAFALYSIGFLYGDVALVIFLFFLTPVWSTLIARYALGWPTPPARLWAMGLGLLGLGVLVSGQGVAPSGALGMLCGLVSGILWAVSTTLLRVRPSLAPVPSAGVFAFGACGAALGLAFVAAPEVPTFAPLPFAVALGTGTLWWGASMIGLIWAASRLDPARVGLLLMAEVVVGTGSAAVLAGEHLGVWEMLGGGLVILAGLVDLRAEPADLS